MPPAGALRLLSLFVQDQRSVQQQAAQTGCSGICWAHLLDHGEGERLRAFWLTIFPHHAVREARLRRPAASLCGQNNRVTRGGKQQSPDGYFRPTQSLTSCQSPRVVPSCRSLSAHFDRSVLFRFAFLSLLGSRHLPTVSLSGSRDRN